MRTALLLIIIFTFFPFSLNAQGIRQQDRVQELNTHISTTVNLSPNQVGYKNRVATQNKGEDTELRVVTQQMQQLMQMEGLEGQVGEKVKTLAREQSQAQTAIQIQLNKLETRSNFLRKLFGPDFAAVKNLNYQIEQNRLRISSLQQLLNQVQNEADKDQLQLAVESLSQQNVSLQEQVQAEEKAGGVFGWFVRLFYR